MISKFAWLLPVGLVILAISFIAPRFFEISDFFYGFLHGSSLVFILAGLLKFTVKEKSETGRSFNHIGLLQSLIL